MSEGCKEPGEHDHEHTPARTAESTFMMRFPSNLNNSGKLLTPHDVRNKVFPTVRLREGYDLAEVDTFLGEIEFTLSRVLWENEQLNAQLNVARNSFRQALPSAGDNAARIVARAQQSADEVITRAEQEARLIVAEARGLAETIEREALDRATALEHDTRERHRGAAETLEAAYAAQQRRIDGLRDLVGHHGGLVQETLAGHLGQLQRLLLEVKEQGGPLATGEQPPVTTRHPMPVPRASHPANARTGASADDLLTEDL
ncbi:DivIVA domain-containing protein [Streptosporangium sp. NPDC051023]|uniref:DivIVA domain-containing protein n=1 Tax=Streptosporangium sp. NPDC051023 TaxID=3155410 RepID=UPI00344D5F48